MVFAPKTRERVLEEYAIALGATVQLLTLSEMYYLTRTSGCKPTLGSFDAHSVTIKIAPKDEYLLYALSKGTGNTAGVGSCTQQEGTGNTAGVGSCTQQEGTGNTAGIAEREYLHTLAHEIGHLAQHLAGKPRKEYTNTDFRGMSEVYWASAHSRNKRGLLGPPLTVSSHE